MVVVLALAVVPGISVAVRKFGRFLRELSHKTQAAAAAAASIAEVCLNHFASSLLLLQLNNMIYSIMHNVLDCAIKYDIFDDA